MFIDNYKKFEQHSPLLLPPHQPENRPNQSIMKMSDLVKLYPEPLTLGNKINSFCVGGVYLTVKEYSTGVELIPQQEPMIIFGVEENKEITIGPYNGLRVSVDSIIIYVKIDQSIYFLSLDDEYVLTFTRPNTRITSYDPYGEEDWE